MATMKIQIRRLGRTLTKPQRARLETQLELVLMRFGQRIGRVSVRLSDAASLPGYVRCELEVRVDTELVTVEHSDINLFVALEHASTRAARSVGRAIEKQSWSAR